MENIGITAGTIRMHTKEEYTRDKCNVNLSLLFHSFLQCTLVHNFFTSSKSRYHFTDSFHDYLIPNAFRENGFFTLLVVNNFFSPSYSYNLAMLNSCIFTYLVSLANQVSYRIILMVSHMAATIYNLILSFGRNGDLVVCTRGLNTLRWLPREHEILGEVHWINHRK